MRALLQARITDKEAGIQVMLEGAVAQETQCKVKLALFTTGLS